MSVGASRWARFGGDRVQSEAVEIMVGEEAEEMGSRAKKLACGNDKKEWERRWIIVQGLELLD